MAIYSTFLQRSYDQVIHDVCLQNLPVTFCIDRAGLVGEDGATHHGMFDLAYMRHIPNMKLIAPRDENILRHALYTSLNSGGPSALRYPRGVAFGVELEHRLKILPLGVGDVLVSGEKLAIIACGNRAHPAREASLVIEKELGFKPLVFDPVWIKPLPKEQLIDIAKNFQYCILVEDGVLAGGFSSSVLELLSDLDLLNNIHIKRIGIPDTFIEHGTQLELRELCGLRGHCIAQTAIDFYRQYVKE